MLLRRAILVWVTALALSLGLGVGISAFGQDSESHPEDDALQVEWAYQPQSLPELVDQTPSIVMAEVQDVQAGDGVPAGDGTAIPTQRVDLRVFDTIAGQTPKTFTLFQLGAPGFHADGDPAYAVGERYLLFIKRRLNDAGTAPNPDGTWLPVAPDGRFEAVASELDATIDGPVADQLDGASVSEATADIAAAQEEAP